jgi:uncharacterized membrane protein (UPF0127 family)
VSSAPGQPSADAPPAGTPPSAPAPEPEESKGRSWLIWLSTACLAGALVLIVVAVIAIARRDHEGPGRTAAPATTIAPLAGKADPAPHGFRAVEVSIVDAVGKQASWCLMLADTTARQDQGLMWVTDRHLAGYDGMLFAFATENSTSFWMRNTPQELGIAFFDGDGKFVSATRMYPCGDRADCPQYPAAAPYRYAIEVPAGNLGRLGIGVGSRLVIPSGGADACSRAP